MVLNDGLVEMYQKMKVTLFQNRGQSEGASLIMKLSKTVEVLEKFALFSQESLQYLQQVKKTSKDDLS